MGAISATDIISIIQGEIENINWDEESRETGEVIWVGDGIVTVYGIDHAMYGEIVAFENGVKSLIGRAKEYVHDNYQQEDLGLDDICKELGVSNSYFSSMFKKETGNSFVGYLTEYRMDKAARMLVETAEKSYMIAKSVGYSDPNYFSYVFKRQFGVSPSKYRTAYEKNEK